MSKQTKPFGELSRDEKLALMTAWVDGKTIQVLTWPNETWEDITRIHWDSEASYRIKPDTPDYIDWSHVSPEYKWMARDRNSTVLLHERKPKNSGSFWIRGGATVPARIFTSYKQGTVDWKDSLVKRDS